MEYYDAKFLYRYGGGEIKRCPNDSKISYVGGHNNILYVSCEIDFTAMLAEPSALFDAAGVDLEGEREREIWLRWGLTWRERANEDNSGGEEGSLGFLDSFLWFG
ncbi:uncharacterized protein DS421_16g548770 [Arachis hypogaea]|nr:uncharacterized protein DS421_16g548770 [Arachis hypogaea]